jgi:hypothetical protein
VLASQIMRSLPESLDWMVLFDLSTLRQLVADEAVMGMFFLPECTDLYLHSHVILTSQGTLAAAREGYMFGRLPADRDFDSIKEQRIEAHPRYGCRNHAEYVQWFALPPYTGESPWV